MKSIKSLLNDYLGPFLLVLLLGILFTVFLYLFVSIFIDYDILSESSQEKRLDGTIKIIGTSISLTGFISIIVTIIYAKKTIQRDIQQGTVGLFQEFNSPRFREVRSEAWVVMSKWHNEPDYKERFMKFIETDTSDEEFKKAQSLVYELLEFYSIVSVYDGNENLLKGLRYFYYGWWRHFLYDIGGHLEANRKVNSLLNERKSDYIDSLSYIKSLERMDELCGLTKVPRDTPIHLNGV